MLLQGWGRAVCQPFLCPFYAASEPASAPTANLLARSIDNASSSPLSLHTPLCIQCAKYVASIDLQVLQSFLQTLKKSYKYIIVEVVKNLVYVVVQEFSPKEISQYTLRAVVCGSYHELSVFSQRVFIFSILLLLLLIATEPRSVRHRHVVSSTRHVMPSGRPTATNYCLSLCEYRFYSVWV